MKTFGWSLDYVRKRLPTAQGWAYLAWAQMDAATALGGRLKLIGKGYIGQEADKMKRKAKRG